MAGEPTQSGNGVTPNLPGAGFAQKYGLHIGVTGMSLALLEIFRDDPKSSIGLFAQFGPKYILWGLIAYFLWDVSKRLLRVLNKGVDKIGMMAENTGKVAGAMDQLASKNDRQAEEMRRLCSFSASQAERAVELAHEVNSTTRDTNEMLKRLLDQKSEGSGS